MKLEGGSGGIVPVEPEPEETDDERMARFLKASGAAAEFLATDIDKILESCCPGGGTRGSAEDGGTVEDQVVPVQVDGDNDVGDNSTMEKLRLVANEAAEYSLFCRNSNTGSRCGEGKVELVGNENNRDGLNDTGAAVERAEALCGLVADLLSTHHSGNDPLRRGSVSAANGDVQRKASSSGGGNSDKENKRINNKEYSHISDITCPNGRKDLPLRLATVRDALLPVIGEGTSLGSLKVALQTLTANVRGSVDKNHAADLSETRWHDLHGTVSSLKNTVSDMKNSLRDKNGSHHRHSMDMDDDGGGSGGGERGVTEDDLEDRLGFKADVSWVQHELQRLWNALNSRSVAPVVVSSGVGSGGLRQDNSSRPRSAPSSSNSNSRSNNEKNNPETAGEEESEVDASVSLSPNSRAISASLPSMTVLSTGLGGGVSGSAVSVGRLQQAEHEQRSSFNEGSSLMKDLLRKTSRLEQQVGQGVARRLSSQTNVIIVMVRASRVWCPVTKEVRRQTPSILGQSTKLQVILPMRRPIV